MPADEGMLERGAPPHVEDATLDASERLRQNESLHAAVGASRAGAYVLGDKIAEGGFGVIYRAVHEARGTPAAVKILHADLVVEPAVLVRFEREVEAIRRIGHANLVQIFDVGSLDNVRPYFAMELLTGSTLEQHLITRARLLPAEAIAVLEPLCGALSAAHRQGIVHRDIKPSNVFLCDEAQGRRVVLLDFGVAKLFDAEGPSLTSSRSVVGTPAFMSPEQLLNQPVDARTDVYALGALLYTMLTGAPPFQDTAYPLLRQLHLHCAPPRPSTRAPVSPAFDGPILRAMSKDPGARQPSAGDFLAEVRAAAERAAGDEARDGAPRVRRVLGLHIEVMADADALDTPTEALLADFESVLPASIRELASAGFSSVAETGTSALVAMPSPVDPHGEDQARRAAVRAAIALRRRLCARSGRDPRVKIRLCMHAGEVRTAADGTPIGGDLLDIAGWVPDAIEEGVYASAAVLRGLDAVTSSGPSPAPGAIALLRVEDRTAS